MLLGFVNFHVLFLCVEECGKGMVEKRVFRIVMLLLKKVTTLASFFYFLIFFLKKKSMRALSPEFLVYAFSISRGCYDFFILLKLKLLCFYFLVE